MWYRADRGGQATLGGNDQSGGRSGADGQIGATAPYGPGHRWLGSHAAETITVGDAASEPSDVAINPAGDLAIVSLNKAAASQCCGSTASRSRSKRRKLPLYGQPYHVQITPDGALATVRRCWQSEWLGRRPADVDRSDHGSNPHDRSRESRHRARVVRYQSRRPPGGRGLDGRVECAGRQSAAHRVRSLRFSSATGSRFRASRTAHRADSRGSLLHARRQVSGRARTRRQATNDLCREGGCA